MRNPIRRNRGPQRGSALIEFALSIFMVVLLMFWVFEMVMLVYTYSVLADAAKEGVRYAIVHGSGVAPANQSGPGNTAAVSTVVTDYAQFSLHDVSAITVTPTYLNGDNQAPDLVQVTVSYTYIPYIKLPFTSPTINTSAEGRIVY